MKRKVSFCLMLCLLLMGAQLSAMEWLHDRMDGLDEVLALTRSLANEIQLTINIFEENAAGLDLNHKWIDRTLNSGGATMAVLYIPEDQAVLPLFSDDMDLVLTEQDKQAIDQAFQITEGEQVPDALYRGLCELTARVYAGRDFRRDEVIDRALGDPAPEPSANVLLWVCAGLVPILGVTLLILRRKGRRSDD